MFMEANLIFHLYVENQWHAAEKHTHTPLFNDPLSGTTRVGWDQKKFTHSNQ